MSKGWDNATLKKLKALTGKGLSTAEIGKRLGLSKNAVVGKLNRLGWNLKAGGAPAVAAAPEKKAPTPAKKPAPKKPAAAPKKSTVTPKETKKPAPTKKTPAKQVATEKKPAPKAAAKTEIVAKEPAAKGGSKALNKNLAMHQRIVQHSLEMANLKPNQCRWPIGDPDSENFHFCGETVFVGKPYCYEHCRQAYQFTPPKKK